MKCCTELNSALRTQDSGLRRFWRVLLISAFCVLSSEWVVEACPLCKEAISAIKGLSDGLYWGILLMLATPFLVVAVITSLILKSHRQASKQSNK